MTLRADSGFWSYKLIDTLTRLGIGYSITVHLNAQIKACIAHIAPDAWTLIDYALGGEAAVADTIYVTGRSSTRREFRLVVRRSRLIDPAQAQLWPDSHYHAIITSLDVDVVAADQFHARPRENRTRDP